MDKPTSAAGRVPKYLPYLSVAVGLAALLLTVATLEDLGITTDEPGYYRSCLKQIEWFGQAGEAFADGKWAEPLSSSVLDSYWNYSPEFNVHPHFYKLCSSVTLTLFGRWLGPMGAYRLSPAIMFALLVALLFQTVGRRYGTAAGFWAAGAFLLMPRVFGHAHLGATDMPLSLLWFAAAASFYRALESRRWAAVFAVVYGLALATKFTAFIIPVPLVLFVLLTRRFRQAVLPLGLALVISPLVMLSLNPQWWHDPFERIFTFIFSSITRSRHYYSDASIHYLGKDYVFFLPWHHSLVYTAFTVPPVALAGFLYGSYKTLRNPLADPWASHMLLHWLALTAVMMLPGSPGHDGVRLFLPSFAFIAVLSAKGFHHLVPHARELLGRLLGRLKTRAQPLAASVLLGLLVVPAAVVLARLHPYELCYYNVLAGGMSGADKLGMETTYWWDPVNGSACELINTTLPDSSVISTRNNDLFRFLQELGRIKPSLRFDVMYPEYYLIYFRQGIFRDLDRVILRYGRPVCEVQKNRVPLLKIYNYRESVLQILADVNARTQSPGHPASLHYEAALAYEALNDVIPMLDELKRCLELKPRDFKATILLSDALLRLNRPKESIALLERLSGNIEDPESWNRRMASAHYQLGNHLRAVYYLNEVLKVKSLDPETHAILGQIYYVQRNYQKAIEHLKLTLYINQDDVDILHRIGSIDRETGNIPEARRYFEKVLELEPGHPETLTDLGMLAQQEGDTGGAESFYLRALAADSTQVVASGKLARVYLESGRKDLAEKYYQAVLATEPDDFQAHLGLAAVCLDDSSRWPEALELLRTAARLDPEKAEYLENNFLIPLQRKIADQANP
ncbi:MAG: tetratricopeptide repeat protein [Candidatus Glassbacteria bacterium]|nr:tetratricopeptide repeat protein [Candidatus Glassbacteria bacterium]